jgi:hypothetical protein
MSGTFQQFMASAVPAGAKDLITALERLPEDKRGWKAEGKARTALDMVAECATLNGLTADMIISKQFPEFDYAGFQQAKDDLGADLNALKALLEANSAKVAGIIQNVPDEDLKIVVELPWGPSPLSEVMAYPYWNMKYHEGQINFIASMLGCLD